MLTSETHLEEEEEEKSLLFDKIPGWLPNKVAEREQRKSAHLLYLLLLLGFLAACIFQVFLFFEKRADPDVLSKFELEEFPFPVVTVCGGSTSPREHLFQDYDCYFCDYSFPSNEACEMELNNMEYCESELIDTLPSGAYSDIPNVPCVSFNTEAIQHVDKAGFRNFAIELSGNTTAADYTDSKFCDLCEEGQVPEYYTIIVSEYDITEVGGDDQDWTSMDIPSAGYLSMKIEMQVYTWLDGEKERRFTLTPSNVIPWDRAHANSNVLLLEIEPQLLGVHYLTESASSVTAVLGILGGLFAYVAVIFGFCFAEKEQLPNLEATVVTATLLPSCKTSDKRVAGHDERERASEASSNT